MTTLVTGGTGFLGSALVRHLLAAGHRVRVLARPGGPRANLADLPVEVVEGDLTDPSTLEPALEGCQALFHLAADYRLWVPDPERMYRANVEGTRTLLRAANRTGVGRIVYTSSVATLAARADGEPADESRSAPEADQIGPYKRSKVLAEAEVRRQVREEGLPAVIVNPSTPVGPRDARPTPTGRMILDAAAGRMPAYVDTGLNLVHVDDVAAGHLAALEHGRLGERYILGGENLALREVLARVAALMGRRPPRVRLPRGLVLPVAYGAEAWAGLTGREPLATVTGVKLARKRMYFTSAKAEAELGHRARPADEALAEALEWFRAQGRLDRDPRAAAEGSRRTAGPARAPNREA
ncbi:hopanoid-associated sugar epimerase [Thiohalorhabdus denitrificans]|uniref:Dihydroflavonol-4-reductase n=1 Tax=Thiohalorhabdus denitrificans TaxID=381306 RepID=A0A1G5AVP8_9GAMM|nr:hopanoid-associated sugar epimerase [Thiohalorhabdus denitrificans]SCX81921.1 dihydroflavonol-4-reductase [Thiohalorhabdus denitrificans]